MQLIILIHLLLGFPQQFLITTTIAVIECVACGIMLRWFDSRWRALFAVFVGLYGAVTSVNGILFVR